MPLSERTRDHIRQMMSSKNISKSELARRAGLSSRTVRDALNGNGNPAENTLVAIAKALGVDLMSMIEGSEVPAAPVQGVTVFIAAVRDEADMDALVCKIRRLVGDANIRKLEVSDGDQAGTD